MVNLQEAFSKLNMMESGDFELLKEDEKDAMKSFLDEEPVEAEEVEIIDPQATDETELEDSYVGKIIVQCPVCKSLIYKTQEEISEEGSEPQTCPYCFSVETFDLIGKIVPLEDETAPEVVEEEPAAEEAPAMEEACDKCPECGQSPCVCEDKCEECGDAPLKEDLENVTIETEDEVITVSAEEKPECPECEAAAEMTEEPAAEEEHEEAEVIAPLDDAEEDSFDIDEIDEDSFDEFAESLLMDKYSNITGYKTSKIKDCGTYALAEGVVTLKNGDKKLTEFKIRPSKLNRNKAGSCLVENVQLKARKIAKISVR